MKKIKLQQVQLGGVKPLSRSELKSVFGEGRPTSPSIGGGGDYMCCNNHGCSACVTNAIPACVAGAWPVGC
ncbi:hypothetical protein [Chryseobacterium sp.]|uniref:hypothetical protein n=1 Tax=Chryseobacterium sp. TaxID=1871047 RepID=UPI0028A27701|nr:hypothetical protein [Chryseobacterium sp.]